MDATILLSVLCDLLVSSSSILILKGRVKGAGDGFIITYENSIFLAHIIYTLQEVVNMICII